MAKGREQWRSVRRRRAEPPAFAGQAEDRKQVFQSALAQAEELWDAAAVAGPASRPLPLSYCISQAGRAVCAAWTREDEWRPRAHGLRRRESSAQLPEARVFDYAAAVARQPLGSYAMVASSTASPTFSGFATVAELALERTPAVISEALAGPTAYLMREELRRHGAQAAAFVDEEPPPMTPVNE